MTSDTTPEHKPRPEIANDSLPSPPEPAGAEPVIDLVDLLTLQPIGEDRFEGMSRNFGTGRVFGGQVLGQALAAAYATVDAATQRAHSLHAYFLRPGDHDASILYEVDRQRDGRSYANRRVVATQDGRPIFNLTASFHLDEAGPEHQQAMPAVPPPEHVRDLAAWIDKSATSRGGRSVPAWVRHLGRVEFRPLQPPSMLSGEPGVPQSMIWFRVRQSRSDHRGMEQCQLALLSDFWLLMAAARPHLRPDRRLSMASLDHAMWFHRPFELDDWLLYCIDGPSTTAGRGLARGEIFSRDGRLVAVVAQEGVVRHDTSSMRRRDGKTDA